MPSLRSPATVLVTGATGYIATHIIRAYIDDGYTVIGTVRRAERGAYLMKLFPERFSFVEITELATPEVLKSFVHRVDIIAHTTAPMIWPKSPFDPQLIIAPTVGTTLSVLNSAAAPGSRVQRVILLGSIASVTNVETHDGPHEILDKDHNDWALQEVETKGSGATAFTVYSAAKLLSERAADNFVAQHKPQFDIVHVLPYFVYGPIMHDVRSVVDFTGSLKRFWECMEHSQDHPPEQYIGGFIDVRDVARAYLDATTREDLSGSRLLCTSQHCITIQDLYDAYYAIPDTERPKLPFDVPRGCPGLGEARRASFPTFSRTSQERLGWELTGLVECVRDMLQSFFEKGLL